jgi:hypothetical protein
MVNICGSLVGYWLYYCTIYIFSLGLSYPWLTFLLSKTIYVLQMHKQCRSCFLTFDTLGWGGAFLGNVLIMLCVTGMAYRWRCWWVVLGVWYLHCHNEILLCLRPGGAVSCLNLNLRVSTRHSMPFCMSCPESSEVSQPALESDFGNSSMPCEHNVSKPTCQIGHTQCCCLLDVKQCDEIECHLLTMWVYGCKRE